MEAVILAGGLGRRLRDEVPDLPKPMAPVGGRPFLEYLLDYWISQGVNRFVLSVGYRREAIVSHFGSSYKGSEIVYAAEDKPRGTGGGLLLAMEQLRHPGTFLAMNGDTFFEVNLDELRQFHVQAGADVTVALRKLDNNVRYAVVEVDGTGRITTFENRARSAGLALVNGGIYLANRPAFAEVEGVRDDSSVSFEEQMIPQMLASGVLLYGFTAPGKFIDIGIPEDYRRASEMMTDF